MTEADEKQPDGQPSAGDHEPADASMAALRQLIVGPEQVQLEQIQRRLADPWQRTRDISKVLPQAIAHSARKDGKVIDALMPVVEKAVKTSVKKNLNTFVDALYPIMGPAIRKAIAEAFRTMVQSLNSAVEQSFSLQGLKWRIESMRSGKTFAEVVLLHSLVYRVEQVFLIHGETGLLLQHISAGDQALEDADLVSGMLTAIQDFVKDSFSVRRDQSLDTIQVGDLTVWIERGPLAFLAVAIRGNAHEELRVIFREALERIHLEKSVALEDFDGDPAVFENARYHLTACLKAHYKSKSRRVSPMLITMLTATVLALGAWGAWAVRSQHRWAAVLETLRAEPGIVVTSVEENNGKYRINGLKDPLARDPAAILAHTPVRPGSVSYHLEPYQNLRPEFVLKRAENTLRPPASVALSLQNGTLVALGSAPYRWVAGARTLATAVTGVARLDDSGLVITELLDLKPPDTVNLTLKDGILTAAGTAPQRWIDQTRDKARRIPGVWMVIDTGLTASAPDETEQRAD